jgi:hypothetical protein
MLECCCRNNNLHNFKLFCICQINYQLILGGSLLINLSLLIVTLSFYNVIFITMLYVREGSISSRPFWIFDHLLALGDFKSRKICPWTLLLYIMLAWLFFCYLKKRKECKDVFYICWVEVWKHPWIHALELPSPWETHLYRNLTYNMNLEHVPQLQQ